MTEAEVRDAVHRAKEEEKEKAVADHEAASKRNEARSAEIEKLERQYAALRNQYQQVQRARSDRLRELTSSKI
ncbi:MAG: hypothetical protein AAF236_05100, partial [Verrucomicrobiota bacterium]